MVDGAFSSDSASGVATAAPYSHAMAAIASAAGIGANVRHCPLPRRPRRGERLRSLRGEVSLEGLKDLMFAPSEELSPIVLVEEALRETRCIVEPGFWAKMAT